MTGGHLLFLPTNQTRGYLIRRRTGTRKVGWHSCYAGTLWKLRAPTPRWDSTAWEGMLVVTRVHVLLHPLLVLPELGLGRRLLLSRKHHT